jgi:predicted Fe-Mo cluster-binding NifX family protein
MVKIVITTTADTLDAQLDPRFGRAAKFAVYDLEDDSFEILDNQQNRQAAQGAGIQAAQTVVQSGAQALVTGHCGPKAFQVLQLAGIKVYNTNAVKVADAIAQYRQGELNEAGSANVEGHW